MKELDELIFFWFKKEGSSIRFKVETKANIQVIQNVTSSLTKISSEIQQDFP